MSFVFNTSANFDWSGATTVRCMLERSTSSYTPNRDHDFVSDVTGAGFTEISVASYARQTVTSRTETVDDTNDRIGWGMATASFGSLESGQSVKGLMFYEQIGGDDSTPGDDRLILRLDGKFDVVLAADASSSATTLWVEPLLNALPNGTSLDFGGGATCSLSSAATQGARSLSVTALGAAGTAGDTSEADTGLYPQALDNGLFTVSFGTSSLVFQVPR